MAGRPHPAVPAGNTVGGAADGLGSLLSAWWRAGPRVIVGPGRLDLADVPVRPGDELPDRLHQRPAQRGALVGDAGRPGRVHRPAPPPLPPHPPPPHRHPPPPPSFHSP